MVTIKFCHEKSYSQFEMLIKRSFLHYFSSIFSFIASLTCIDFGISFRLQVSGRGNQQQPIIQQSHSEQGKKISNDQELIQSDPISCPQNQKGNN